MTRSMPAADLPPALAGLRDLALDLRWTCSHGGDALWRRLDPALWAQTENPWLLLQYASRALLERSAKDPEVVAAVGALEEERRRSLVDPGWYGTTHAGSPLGVVAYFCMEYGLGSALPLYAGGLGVLAGDCLKAAADLGVPMVAVGLLYQEGFFRQMLGTDHGQVEIYPYNDPTTLPIEPVVSPSGGWQHVELDLPGRRLRLRIWVARVGRVPLYLLDSNDPMNSPLDRGITSKLYGGGPDLRLLQEIVLGIGGWRALEALGVSVDLCHLNEGHAAFALIERAHAFRREHGGSFAEALWATRAGNVFTTHTAVGAAFDRYDAATMERFAPYVARYAEELGISPREIYALGRANPDDEDEPFNMAFLGLRGSGVVNGVSRLHGEVSRELFQGIFPRWPAAEIPVTHVTNGVHMPSWDSPAADRVWESAYGKGCWRGPLVDGTGPPPAVADETLWALRVEARQELVRYARASLLRQLGRQGAVASRLEEGSRVLDPYALTLGFARRFTEYKRPNLLLHDRERLLRLLSDPDRPAQLVVAGKAHPADGWGKGAIAEWVALAESPEGAGRVVFLADYDLTMAEELVRGVDVWINTPRRPWEACGTSGMKVLPNGGLNLSTLDGWWAEAYRADAGWAVGEGAESEREMSDAEEALQLYEILEREVVPEFYRRDERGIPTGWVARMRVSMGSLAPRFSASRMLREYTERLYLPAAERLARRRGDGGAPRRLEEWRTRLERGWHTLHFGDVDVERVGGVWHYRVPVYLGDLDDSLLRVELYSDPPGDAAPVPVRMERREAIPGFSNAAIYGAEVPDDRPAEHFTPRIVPYHPEARVPLECPLILWQR